MDVYTASGQAGATAAPTRPAEAVSACCICAVVSEQALEGLLTATREGAYRDEHPWLVARERLDAASRRGERLAVMFAAGDPLHFSHWAYVKSIDVRELHKGAWETRCAFAPLAPVNPIWEALDSVLLVPSAEQLRRETLEGIRKHRQALTAALVHPYALCETPPFIKAG